MYSPKMVCGKDLISMSTMMSRRHLQVLNLFGLKFLHVIFEACGGPQTFNFSFLEGRFKLYSQRKSSTIQTTHSGWIPVTENQSKGKSYEYMVMWLY